MGIVAESDGETYESYKAKQNPENARSTAPPPRPAQKTDPSQKSEPLKITKSEWDKIHKDYKGEWTRERWEWDNDFPEEFIGRKTVIEQALPDSVFERSGRKKEYGSGSVLITEGGGFEIIPDERQNANNAPASPYDNIPDELKSLKQWTVYKTYPDKDNPGKLKKVIISPIDSSFAHSDAPDMWASYEQAKAYADRHGYKGLVFALGTGITFIDIDRAVDKDSGAIVSPEARRLLELIPDSYTERSVSGTGIHILVKGSLPSDAYRRNDAKGIEMYDNRRFICVTGDTINGSREVKDYSDRIAAIAYEFAGRRPPRKEYTPVPATQSDNELIGRIEISKQGAKFEALYRGDISGYPSHSHADSAIVFTLAWWTRDPAQIDRIFRSSGLMRDKWDSIRGGTTYGGQLIDEALSTVTAREQPQRQRQAEQY
jgi:hypothetical protein